MDVLFLRQVGDLAYQVLCSRVYTDSTLCLEEDPLMCLCAAVQFALLVSDSPFCFAEMQRGGRDGGIPRI